MALPILREDALASTEGGVAVRMSLPWIRSLPISSIADLTVTIDGERVTIDAVRLGDLAIPPDRIIDEDAWWFLQDRIEVSAQRMLTPGRHDVAVSFRLVIPYLPAGPDAPLALPFHAERTLELDAAGPTPAVGRAGAHPRVVERSAAHPRVVERAAAHPRVVERAAAHPRVVERAKRDETPPLPPGWTLAASAFNWTPEVISAERPAPEIAARIVADGVADVIEVELGQLWRSFPDPADADADALRAELDRLGGSVSIVGASIDDWSTPTRRRDDDERLAFLLPQLRAAQRLGATGLRLPIGQAGTPLLRRLLPALHDLDLVLYEEVQGQQPPSSPAHAAAYDAIAELDDPHVRLLVDISMLMPALPASYLAELRSGGVPDSLVDALASDWRSPQTHEAVIDLLRSGQVPPRVHTMFMNLIVRFGRSDAADLRGVLPLVGGFHLKFWDLDDTDGRVSRPIRDLGVELARSGFAGTLCSEWGGHEWIEGLDAADTTRAHLRLARTALAEGARTITTSRGESTWLTPSAT